MSNPEKRVTLEDVRREPSLLERFMDQHPSKADRARFEKLLEDTVKTPPKGDQT